MLLKIDDFIKIHGGDGGGTHLYFIPQSDESYINLKETYSNKPNVDRRFYLVYQLEYINQKFHYRHYNDNEGNSIYGTTDYVIVVNISDIIVMKSGFHTYFLNKIVLRRNKYMLAKHSKKYKKYHKYELKNKQYYICLNKNMDHTHVCKYQLLKANDDDIKNFYVNGDNIHTIILGERDFVEDVDEPQPVQVVAALQPVQVVVEPQASTSAAAAAAQQQQQ